MNLTVETILGLILSISSVITATALGVRWLVKHYFDEIKHELKPNSGNSMKDQVTRLEKDITELKDQNKNGELYHQRLDDKIDNLTKMFVEYVSNQKTRV